MAAIETTIAAANIRIRHDKSANLVRFAELIEEAAGRGVEFLVFPELALQGYIDFGFLPESPDAAEQRLYYFHEAEEIPGPATLELGVHAERFGMYIQMGMAERALNGNIIYNSVALVGPDGLLGVYRKMHNQFEYPYFMPGESQGVFDVPFARIGSSICYDIIFPEHARAYALHGSHLLAVSTAWPMQGHNPADDYYGWAMDVATQGNAFFNQMWVVISNHCETEVYSTRIDYYGKSKIVDPFGRVVAEAEPGECLVVHTADLRDQVVQSRTAGLFGLNFLRDRRPERYVV